MGSNTSESVATLTWHLQATSYILKVPGEFLPLSLKHMLRNSASATASVTHATLIRLVRPFFYADIPSVMSALIYWGVKLRFPFPEVTK